MKAVRYHAYGDVPVLEEADRPVAGAGQVLVRVAGTSVNLLDVAIRLGILRETFALTFPHIPNVDVAGVVTAVGEGVTSWKTGDAVIGVLPPATPGAAAAYAVAPADALVAAPRTVDLADAAALPLVGLTAWQALFEHAELKPGQGVLINGAGGGVGGYAIQLAKRAGATVTATASARSRDRVRAYGADRVIDYTTTPLPADERFDVVLHLVREEPAQLVDLVAEGGVFVSTTISPADARVRTEQVFVRTDTGQLAELVSLVDSGKLHVDVAERRPLAELAAVHDQASAGKLAGKTVLAP